MFTLLRLLSRNLKGYHHLVVIAVVMALAQVGSDLLAAFPFKFIADKIQKGTNPPAFLNGPLWLFDLLGSGIERIPPHQHSLISVIFLAAVLLILFGLSILLGMTLLAFIWTLRSLKQPQHTQIARSRLKTRSSRS